MGKKKYYKFLDDKQEWVIRNRTNRKQEYRVGRNKRYTEKIVDLLNSLNDDLNNCKIQNDYLAAFNSELQMKLRKIMTIVDEADYFSDEAIEHDIIAYREMHTFDNKDAYAIACAFKEIKEVLDDD